MGADTLFGGSGNDLLAGYFGLDRYYGGSGNDTVNVAYSDQNWVVDLDPGFRPGLRQQPGWRH